MRTVFVLLIVVLFLVVAYSMATGFGTKTYRVASYYIPLLVEDPDNGAFIEVLREVAERAGIRYEIVMAPPRRSMRQFEDAEVDVLIPALRATLGKDAALTRPIFTKQIHAVVREGTRLPGSVEELEGLRVGLTRGFSFPRSITVNEKIEIDYADTTDASLKKLLEGRIDVVVADGYSAISAIEKMKLTGFAHDLTSVLYEQNVYIACQPTAEGRKLADRLSVILDSMEADGTMDRILPDIERVVR